MAAAARAEIVAVGDELVHGHGLDTNSAWLSRELELLGVEVVRHTTVGDGPDVLGAALRTACAEVDVVVVTGGLGPTEDDRTRHVAAEVGGVELRFDDDSWSRIAELYARRAMTPPESNRIQALFPVGAEVLANDWGTAPGFAQRIGEARLFALPGVPREMRKMFAARVEPMLSAAFGDGAALAFHQLHVVGPTEAQLGELIADVMRHDHNPRVGITAHYGKLTVRLVASDASREAAARLCGETAAQLRARIGDEVVYEGERSPAQEVGHALLERGVTLAIAESCTAGMLSADLGSVPGISDVLLAGFVTYSNAAKQRDVGVSAELLADHGAVSKEVAAAMAEGAARRAGARLGIAVTGIAGPGGGTEDKPVGTVCFGLSLDGATTAWRRRFADLGRRFIRERSVLEAEIAILRRLRGSSPGVGAAEKPT